MDLVVIASVPGREHWLRDCLASIERDVLVVSQHGWELDKIRWVYEHVNCERFLFLNDSMIVKDQAFFDLAFGAGTGSVAISNCPTKFGMYLGVFTKATLAKVPMRQVHDKEDSITLEGEWANQYSAAEPDAPLLFDDFTDGHAQRTEARHNRINLRLENDYLIKFKGTWR